VKQQRGFESSCLLTQHSPPSTADSIRNRTQNKATVTYYLLCDNRRKMPSSGYLRSELSEGVVPQSAGAGRRTREEECQASKGMG